MSGSRVALAALLARLSGSEPFADLQRTLDLPGRGVDAEGNHLDGQRVLAQRIHLLRLVGDHHHVARRGGDDLLDQQRTTAALDELVVAVELVGAVDRQVEATDPR